MKHMNPQLEFNKNAGIHIIYTKRTVKLNEFPNQERSKIFIILIIKSCAIQNNRVKPQYNQEYNTELIFKNLLNEEK